MLCDSFRTGTVLPMNECVRVAYAPIHWQMFYRNRCTDRHEHLCDSFGCVAVDLSDRCIPVKIEKDRNRYYWFIQIVFVEIDEYFKKKIVEL